MNIIPSDNLPSNIPVPRPDNVLKPGPIPTLVPSSGIAPIIKRRTLKKKNPEPGLSLNFQPDANKPLPENAILPEIDPGDDLLVKDNAILPGPTIKIKKPVKRNQPVKTPPIVAIQEEPQIIDDVKSNPIPELVSNPGPAIKIKKPRGPRITKKANIPDVIEPDTGVVKPKRGRKKSVKFQTDGERLVIPDIPQNPLPVEPNENIEENKENAIMLKREYDEYVQNATDKDTEYDFLYPQLNDPNFIVKLSKHKEFYDTQVSLL
jgi:hypothetical protein